MDDEEFNPAEWLAPFQRVLKPTGNIFVFTSYNLLGKWHDTFDPVYDTFQFMVWHKVNPAPKIRRAGFLNSCELIACMWNKGHTWNFGKQNEMHNFIETPICMGHERIKDPKHPTQKHIESTEAHPQNCLKPGDVVLDPFMGTGSTGMAALELGRKFYVIELDKKYFAAARLDSSVRQRRSAKLLGSAGTYLAQYTCCCLSRDRVAMSQCFATMHSLRYNFCMVTTLLAKILEPAFEGMPAEFARLLLTLRVDADLRARVEVLRDKASAGLLSDEERQEHEEFVDALDIVALLQVKARRVLASQPR